MGNSNVSSSFFIGDDRNEIIKVLFCTDPNGNDNNLDSGFNQTKKELLNDSNVNVVQCKIEDLDKEIINTHVLIPYLCKIKKNLIEHSNRLQLIHQFGLTYGVDNIDINACIETNIFVCNVPSNSIAVSESCAEHCIFLAIACLRKFKECQNSIISNKLFTPTGRTLYQSNCMIFGSGDIGQMLVNRLKAFEVNKIVTINVSKTDDNDDEKNELDVMNDNLDIKYFPKEAQDIDILFICCSDDEFTNGFVNKEFLSHLKTGVILINISRGSLLNYGDCLDGIESQKIGSIGLDTFYTEPFPISDPLLLHPNVIVTPHIAATTELASNEIPSFVANNIRRMRKGLEPLNYYK